MLISGTTSAVCMKVILICKSAGYIGIIHNYDKPFMQSFMMFIGMSIPLIVRKFWDPDWKGPGKRPPRPFKVTVILAIPAVFDMIATTLNIFGLIYVNLSIFQMLRGSMIIFCAVLSILFLPNKKIKNYEWVGITMTTVALVLIGVAGVYIPGQSGDETEDHSVLQKVFGCLLILLSQLFQAAQNVIEEYLFVGMENTSALDVCGVEGVWGILFVLLVGFPFAFIVPGKDPSPLGNSLENLWDTLLMIGHSKTIPVIYALFVAACCGYNMFGILILGLSSCVNLAILDAIRTFLIWVFMVSAQKLGAPFGEPWVTWSWLELFGFVLLVLASFVYNRVFDLPFLKYQEATE